MVLVLLLFHHYQQFSFFSIYWYFSYWTRQSEPSCSTNFYIFGGVKMMMPNMVKYPIIMLPILITAGISGIAGSLIGIAGTKESAGFGFIGMIGPISAFKFLHVDSAILSILLIILGFFVVPLVTAFILDIIFRKVLRLYTNDIYKFMG